MKNKLESLTRFYLSVVIFSIGGLLFQISNVYAYVGNQHQVVSGNFTSVRHPDVSYNLILEKYLVVWEENEGGDTWSIYGEILNKNGTLDIGHFPIHTYLIVVWTNFFVL